jgi:membrane protease YdiL (CAAX protease family)
VLYILAEVPYLVVGDGVTDTFSAIVLASGAGLYEELIFRALLISLLIVILETMGGKTGWLLVVLAVFISSVLFALAHYVGSESFHWYTFLYRTCAGGLFALLYMVRGIAVAVYTHAFYDMFVFLA